ncbi:S-layer homology domain-containing protein [Microseira wollei]|uniref:S-layer domain-containing protein n=1 Tax=Microseira wollei NIES-4236 TaxID=2530354 RepID=A0AAV3XHK9_9CYAN|nr:S-layer homology domain-containing protein [Microseira wollei]GET39907.1 S-layer domain-containing protein [Microseira wollei NIES-4236]
MLPDKLPVLFLSAALLLTSLTACANSPNSKNLEQSLAADPQLQENPVTLGQPVTDTNPQQNQPQVQLPGDFPSEIPRYPDATLKEVTQQDASQLTRWTSDAPTNIVQSFYQKEFQNNNWEIVSQTTAEESPLVARRNDLQVTVNIRPAPTNVATPSPNQTPATTEFTITYTRNSSVAATATPTPSPSPEVAKEPTPSPEPVTSTNTESQVFADINNAPKELRSYITDLAKLEVLTPNPAAKTNPPTTSNQFAPNTIISRRDYASWLVATNNRMYANNPAKQIRLANSSSQPAFQDVPPTHPDFGAIQGLAEAGLIPSPLSGDSTAVLFRPGAPLTREQMMLWKVPLDTRQSLPNASVDAVKQTWGFQDAGKIDPKALRAILADHQNADVSNIRRVFGFTTLFQPKKPVTRAEAAATLWYFGTQGEGVSAKEALQLKPQSN